jgi:hypothetical protein
MDPWFSASAHGNEEFGTCILPEIKLGKSVKTSCCRDDSLGWLKGVFDARKCIDF